MTTQPETTLLPAENRVEMEDNKTGEAESELEVKTEVEDGNKESQKKDPKREVVVTEVETEDGNKESEEEEEEDSESDEDSESQDKYIPYSWRTITENGKKYAIMQMFEGDPTDKIPLS